MKKLVVVMLILCLAFAGVIQIGAQRAPENVALSEIPEAAVRSETQDEPVQAEGEAAEISYKGLDYEAIRTLHDEDEVVVNMNGRDITWAEYYYWLYIQASQMDQYFSQMSAYYGQAADWGAEVSEGMSFAKLAVENAEFMLLQPDAIENLAKENGIVLTEEDRAGLQEQLENDMNALLGEQASEAAFNESLANAHMTREMYDRLNEADYLFGRGLKQLYGENGELCEDDTVVAWLEESGYLNASHILFMSKDAATGEALDEATVAEKKAQAEAVIAELAAINDPQEREIRFTQIKAEKCEDSGKVEFPDGYIFTQGTMVPEFEASCLSLEDYAISDVVETSYGYHVIMRLPLRAEGKILSNGSAVLASRLYASTQYDQLIQSEIDKLKVEYVPGFESVDLTNYVMK